MRQLLLAPLLLVLGLSTSGCIVAIGPGASDGMHTHWGWSGKRGSGVSATQTRNLAEFHAIRIEGSCDVEATVGGEQSVLVSADDNLIDDLTTEVENGVLVISTRSGSNLSFRVGPKAVVSVRNLDALSIEGSGDARVSGVSSSGFQAKIEGSGDMRVSGNASKLTLSIEGSGDADLSGLECQDASVSIEGSGDARVHCTGSLSAAVSGSGDISYLGTPHTSISISGSGDVHPAR